jgi:hypothetical protein
MPSPQTEVQLFDASGVDYHGAFSGVHSAATYAKAPHGKVALELI